MIDLGGIYISIQGDTSKLEADIARAQSISKTAGSEIAASFTASAANASKLADAIGEVTVATQALSVAQKQAGLSAVSAGQQAVDAAKQQEAELLALFDIEFATPKAPTIPAPDAQSGTAGSPVNSSAIEAVTELGTASTETAVAVTGLGTATTQAALPVAEFGFVSKAAAKFVAEMGAAAALGVAPIASVGAAAAASVVPLAAMGTAAASPAMATAAASATTLGTAVAGAGAAAQKTAPQYNAAANAAQIANSWFASLAGNVPAVTAATNTNTAAVTRLGQAYGHSVSEIQAASGAIRVFEGNQSLRAVESFATRILGLGPAFQAIFPVVGALALGEALFRVFEKTDPLIQAEKELAAATAENDREFEQLGRTLDKINVERITLELGKVAGIKLQSFYDESSAQADEVRIKYLSDLIEQTNKKIGQEADLKSFFGNPLKALNPFEFGAKFGEIRDSQAEAKNVLKFQDEIATKQESLRKFAAQKKLDDEKAAKETAVEGAQTALAGISNQIAANKRLADAKRQAVDNSLALDKQAEDAQIAGAESSKIRALATATQEFQIAQERAAKLKAIDDAELAAHIAMLRKKAAEESVGKDRQQRATIQTNAQGEIAAAEGENAKRRVAIDAALAASAAKVEQTRVTIVRESKVELDTLVRESDQLLERNTAQLEDAATRLEELTAQSNVRISEIEAKGGGPVARETPAAGSFAAVAAQGLDQAKARLAPNAPVETAEATGQIKQLQIQAQKLQLERQYGLEIGHTLSQQIQQETSLFDLDAKGRAAKIAGLESEQQIAALAQQEAAAKKDAATFTGDTKEATKAGQEEVSNKTKVHEIQQQINELREQANNADIEAQIKLDQLRKQRDLRKSIGQDVFNAAQQVPGALGAGLARGIIDGKHIGQDIKQELKGIGQELLGRVLQHVIQELIVKLGIEAAAQAALGFIFGTTATAQTVATTANTVAVVTNTVLDGGVIASNVALTAALVANTVALYLSAASNLFGFAGGGRPAVGVPAIIGEKGPELWVPDQAGTIIPAGKFTVMMPPQKFAEGGRPPVGIQSLFGEKGPELFIPDQARIPLGAGKLNVTLPEGKALPGTNASVSHSDTLASANTSDTIHTVHASDTVTTRFGSSIEGAKRVSANADAQSAQRFPSLLKIENPAARTIGDDAQAFNFRSLAGNLSSTLSGRSGASGALGAQGVSPNLNLSLPDLGLPRNDATLTRTPAPSQRTVTASDGTTIHLHGAQFHGVQNVRELMREISQYAKTQSPRFSPYAR